MQSGTQCINLVCSFPLLEPFSLAFSRPVTLLGDSVVKIMMCVVELL
jgi:hypothetical protein